MRARRAGTRALTFVPLHRGRDVRSRPLGSRAALSALGSAPGPPRWPLPVRSHSPPDLLARRPRPGLSDPLFAPPPRGKLRRRAPRRPAPCASRARPPVRGRLAVPSSSSGARGRREGASLGWARTLGEVLARGRLGRAYKSSSSNRGAANPLRGGGD